MHHSSSPELQGLNGQTTILQPGQVVEISGDVDAPQLRTITTAPPALAAYWAVRALMRDLTRSRTIGGLMSLPKLVFPGEPMTGHRFLIIPTAQPPKPGEGAVNTAEMEIYVDPRAEWRQMYHEAWRIQRDFFYDPNLHGLDLAATEKKYELTLSLKQQSAATKQSAGTFRSARSA